MSRGALELGALSLRAPGRAVAALRGLGLGPAERWGLLALAAALSTLIAWGFLTLFPSALTQEAPLFARGPLVLAGLQFAAMAIAAWLLHRVGRAFGGTGDFADSLLVVAWIELLGAGIEALLLALALVLPALAGILSLVAVGLWALVALRLVTALHGFRNPLLVALGMLATLLAVSFLLSLLVAALGLPVPTP